MTDRICENCRDWVFYCTCYKGPDRELNDSGEFKIIDGTDEVVWNPSNRLLSGNERMIAAIKAELSDNQETICDVGTLWMEEREPIAVAFVAENLGYELGEGAPEFGLPNFGPTNEH